jgi:predicted nucleotidyltransferase
LSFAEVRYLKINFDEILRRLIEYAKSKAETHNVRAIILTGSLAKGTYTGGSDADIVVIADDLPSRILERHSLFSESRLPIDVEPRVYTPEEFIRNIREGDRFALESLEIGIPLHGEQFLMDLKKSIGKPSHKSISKQLNVETV